MRFTRSTAASEIVFLILAAKSAGAKQVLTFLCGWLRPRLALKGAGVDAERECEMCACVCVYGGAGEGAKRAKSDNRRERKGNAQT